MQRPWSGVTPYLPGTDGRRRPYLWLRVQGPSGALVPIIGLVDTGADKSVLPEAYAGFLGYTPEDVKPENVSQVQGSATAWDAKKPCEAHVVGIDSIKFEMYPLFVPTLDALWGRADLMATFQIAVREDTQELTLTLP